MKINFDQLEINKEGMNPQKRVIYSVALFIVVVLASLPAFRSGTYLGHDLPFHLGRIQAIAEGLAQGQFPVRYEESAWYGYGYICTQLYGNIFLYIPALI